MLLVDIIIFQFVYYIEYKEVYIMPTICALGGGGGSGMKFISQETQPTDSKYLDGS